jgi:esterase/lipase superfamily enzyme
MYIAANRGRFMLRKVLFGLTGLVLMGTGCGKANYEFPPDKSIVRVYYATDRKLVDAKLKDTAYNAEHSVDGGLSFGTIDVSIPRDHRMGQIERPSIRRLEIREDLEKHIVLLSVSPESETQFYNQLADTVASSESKDAFVFIHGYDNSFADAAMRTAQLAYDLGFRGAPIMYTWPSKGNLSGYFSAKKKLHGLLRTLSISLKLLPWNHTRPPFT